MVLRGAWVFFVAKTLFHAESWLILCFLLSASSVIVTAVHWSEITSYVGFSLKINKQEVLVVYPRNTDSSSYLHR